MVGFLAFTVFAAVIVVGLYQRGQLRQRVEEAAQTLGLRQRTGKYFQRDWLEGDYHGVPAEVRYTTRSQGKSQVAYTVIRVGGVPEGMTFRKEHLGGSFVRRLTGAEDVATGDPIFDADVIVAGSPVLLSANLDVDARSGVRALLARGAVIEGGAVEVHMRGHITEAASLAQLLDPAADVAGMLGRADALTTRLRAQAESDPIPGVRMTALRVLMGHDAPAAAAAATALLDDFDPCVKVQARLILRDDEGVAAVPVEWLRAYAPTDAEALSRALMRANAEDALVGLLLVERADVRIAACKALARVGTVRAVAPLKALDGGFFGSEEVRNASNGAVAAIQSRMGDVGAGRVSVAVEGGQVSVAQVAGQVSVAKVGG